MKLTWFLAALVVALVAAPLPAGAQEKDKEKKLPDLDEVVKGMEELEGVLRVYQDRQRRQRVLVEIPRRELGQHFLLATSFSGGNELAGWQWTEALVAWEKLDDKLVLVERNARYRADAGTPVEDVVKRTYSDRVMKALPILGEAREQGPGRGYLIDLKELFADNAKSFFGPVGGGLDASLARFSKLKAFPQNVEVAVTMPEKSEGTLTTLHYSLAKLPKTDYKPRLADDRVGYFLTAVKDFSDGKPDDNRFVRYVNRWDLRKAEPSLKLSPPKKPIVFYIEKTVPIRFRRYVREGILEWNKAFEKIGFANAIDVRQQTDDNEFASFDPEDARYNFFRWITSDRSFAMGPSRVNPLTGEILDADIIFDDSMVSSYLQSYDFRIRNMARTFFSPRMREHFAAHPEEHPLAGTRLAPAANDPADEGDAAVESADALAMFDAAGLSPEQMRSFCGLGEGVSHQLSVAAVATATKGGEWPEEFIGALVKDVVMHEVGHTLGLRHNFKASTWLGLGEMNSEKKPAAICASVMDYNPINIAIDPAKQGEWTNVTIGPYDYWAIEYGYKPAEKEADELKAIAARGADKGLAYATDEDTHGADPFVNRWDLGSDPLEYAKEHVALARKLLPTIVDRVVAEGQGFQRARRAFDMLLYDIAFSGHIAARFVGGHEIHRDHKGDPGARLPVVPVPVAKQREALQFICEKIFADSTFEIDPKLLRSLGAGRWAHWGSDMDRDLTYPVHERILAIQRVALRMLLNPETLERVEDQALKVGPDEEALSLPELLGAINGAIFAEWRQEAANATIEAASDPAKRATIRKPAISSIRRNLQRSYLGDMIRIAVQGSPGAPPIFRALVWQELRELKKTLDQALRNAQRFDPYTLAHLEESRARIEKAIEASYRAE